MDIKELKTKKVSAISLGCDKNRVDLEKMLYNIKKFGLEVIPEVELSQIVIVNTCSFIAPAVDEAIQNILEVLDLKNSGVEKVIVTGCLVSRYKDQIKSSIPNVDAFVDIKDNDKIVSTILNLYNLEEKYNWTNGRLLTNLPHFAYLKIADGCDNCCSYCTIPRIRGRYKSVEFDEIITRYGKDLYNEYKLIPLIKELSKIKGIHWIRLHYCYPEMVTDELLNEIKNNPKVCKYIDVPFQHIDQTVLTNMNMHSTEEDIRNLVEKIKTNYPEITIRSTFIIGFPGETKKQFKKLLNFLEEARLQNVGFFPYYKEEKTRAFYLKKQIWNIIKKRRLKKAQKIQEQIMTANNINKIGEKVEIIVDFFDQDEGYYVCRTMSDSPDVDFYVLIENSNNIKVGEFYTAKLKDYIFGFFKGEII